LEEQSAIFNDDKAVSMVFRFAVLRNINRRIKSVDYPVPGFTAHHELLIITKFRFANSCYLLSVRTHPIALANGRLLDIYHSLSVTRETIDIILRRSYSNSSIHYAWFTFRWWFTRPQAINCELQYVYLSTDIGAYVKSA